MEPDRYQNNNKLYILGIICLILALSLFFFSLYTIPFFIWNLKYEIPGFIITMVADFEQQYNLSQIQSNMVVWLIFFIPSIICGYIAYHISNRIDNQIYRINIDINEDEKRSVSPQVTREIKESASLAFKIIFLMLVIVAIVFLLQLIFQI